MFNNNIISTIEIDDSAQIERAGNPTTATITMWRDSQYTITATCYNNYIDATNVFSFPVTRGVVFAIGNDYGNSAPLIISTDVTIGSGTLTIATNTLSETLATDLGNASSKTYSYQIWGTNYYDESYLICDGDVVINNIAIEEVP